MSVSQVVIDRPDLQSGRQRALHSTLTFVAWTAWAYLWLPLVTAVAWFAGMRLFVREIIVPDPTTMLIILALYLVVVSAMGALLVLWARYNRRRFGAGDRRTRVPREAAAPPLVELGLSGEQLTLIQEGDSLRVVHDRDGGVLRVVATPAAYRGIPDSAAEHEQRVAVRAGGGTGVEAAYR